MSGSNPSGVRCSTPVAGPVAIGTETGERMRFPLDGVRVLDLTRALSGPFATRMLSDLGADVVKIEPPRGDLTRAYGSRIGGLASHYTQHNAGKRNVCVDLSAAGADELLRELADVADVLVENFRPGVMDRHGLSWETLRARNPRLVMLSISGFGQEGPNAIARRTLRFSTPKPV